MKSKYLLTEQQIETLAAERQSGAIVIESLDGTYLKALITAMQSKLGPKRGKHPDTATQIETLEVSAAPFYAAVLRGVVTPDIEVTPDLEAAEAARRTRERNRRATFARTAKATLVAWISEGGDARGLDVATVTKTELRASVTAARSERMPAAASRIERAQQAILAAVAREGPDEARERLTAVIEALQAALDELPAEVDTGRIRTRVGVPRFVSPRASVS